MTAVTAPSAVSPGYYRAADGQNYPIPPGYYLASDGHLYPVAPPPGTGASASWWTLSSSLLVGGSGVAAIGSFLPWATLGPFSKAGTDGDGVLTLVLAIICGALAIPGARLRRRGWMVGCLIAALLIVAIAVYDIADVAGAGGSSAFAPSVGSGLIMTPLGGLAAAVGALAGFGKRRA